MKDYKDITNRLLTRRDCYIKEKKRKKQKIIAVATPAFCICFIALLSVGVWYAGTQADVPPVSMEYPVIEIPVSQPGPEYDALPQTYYDLTGPTLEQWLQNPNVVWKDGDFLKGGPDTSISAGPALGSTMICDDLVVIFQENPEDTVYAVMVDFSYIPNQSFLYEGKTLSDWEAQKNSLLQQGKTEEGKIVAIKIHEAKEAYYFERIESFREEFAAIGLGIYYEKYGSTHENCIFYTFATKQQLENFSCAADEAFVFSAAVRFK